MTVAAIISITKDENVIVDEPSPKSSERTGFVSNVLINF